MPGLSCRVHDPVEVLLQRILRNAALLLGTGLASACSEAHGEHDDATSLKPVGPAIACDDGNPQFAHLPVRVSELALAEHFDYVGLRQRVGFEGNDALERVPKAADETWTERQFSVISESGKACATATDAACGEKVGHHPSQLVTTFPCPMACLEDSFVTTRGNQVERWAGSARIKQLLGTIDRPDEAVLMAALKGFEVGCGDAKVGSVAATPAGYEVIATELLSTCPYRTARVRLEVSAAGEITTLESAAPGMSSACAGRRPTGLVSCTRDSGQSPVGDYLARSAHLEAASVIAFERLAGELATLGAPQALVEDALAARDDEVRHAQQVEQLARARGGEPVTVTVAPIGGRTLEEIARENAVEGCVRETYGALVGGYQALTAMDLELRAAMQPIAEDETRHAALSHRVHSWLMSQLDVAARQRVRYAQHRAIFDLATEVRTPITDALRLALGLPSPEVARALLEQLNRALWNQGLVTTSASSASHAA